MNSDDLTDDLKDSENEGNTTQPTITAVFRLLREVRDGQESLREGQESLKTRLDAFEASVIARFETLESSINSRFETLESSINSRFAEISDEFKAALLELSDKLYDRIDRIRLHADSEYEVLLRRIRKLESKAS